MIFITNLASSWWRIRTTMSVGGITRPLHPWAEITSLCSSQQKLTSKCSALLSYQKKSLSHYLNFNILRKWKLWVKWKFIRSNLKYNRGIILRESQILGSNRVVWWVNINLNKRVLAKEAIRSLILMSWRPLRMSLIIRGNFLRIEKRRLVSRFISKTIRRKTSQDLWRYNITSKEPLIFQQHLKIRFIMSLLVVVVITLSRIQSIQPLWKNNQKRKRLLQFNRNQHLKIWARIITWKDRPSCSSLAIILNK